MSVGLLALATPTSADPAYTYAPIPRADFTAVVAPPTAPPTGQDRRLDRSAETTPVSAPASSAAPTPSPRAPRPAARPPVSPSTSHSIAGTATYYCNTDSRRAPLSRCPVGRYGGLYAAISPDLGFLRGKLVTVRYGASVVVVRIVDCDCQAHQSIDLFADAFVRLAPLSAGKLHVTISW